MPPQKGHFLLQEESRPGCDQPMTQSRFHALSFLHTHKDLVDGLDIISVANDFVSLNSVRHNNFGTFTCILYIIFVPIFSESVNLQRHRFIFVITTQAKVYL